MYIWGECGNRKLIVILIKMFRQWVIRVTSATDSPEAPVEAWEIHAWHNCWSDHLRQAGRGSVWKLVWQQVRRSWVASRGRLPK